MCWWTLSLALTVLFPLFCECSKCKKNSDCTNGVCKAQICICNDYWWGDLCQFCRERRLEGDKSKMKIVEGNQNSLPSKCAWLIETNNLPKNRSISLRINEFSGTCGNRSLYIYDGSSVQSPLIAVISNMITAEIPKPLLHVKADSGLAFIVLMGNNKPQDSTGCQFNITYSFEQPCSGLCSSHGFCEEDGHCKCERGWTTSNCSQPTCPVPCINGSCDQKTRRCICLYGFRGESCNISERLESWSAPVVHGQDLLDGVASHAMAVYDNDIWLFGGLSLAKGPLNTLARYSIIENSWELIQASLSSTVNPGERPFARYGHTLVTYKNSLFLFGGTNQSGVFNDLWSFNVISRQWTKHYSTKPLGVIGHTATVVGRTMIVLFGYSLKEGFSRKIQEFNLVDHKWNIEEAPSSVRPTYGHSSVYDAVSQRIYVHGGYRLLSESSCTEASSDLMAYDVLKKQWSTEPFQSSGIPRFLHTAVLTGRRSMLVFGGRGQFRSASPSLAVYSLADKHWRDNVSESLLRYGHSSLLVNSTMHVFGGFGGKMFKSILQYSLGDCLLSTSSIPCGQKPSPSRKKSPGTCVSDVSGQGSCWHQSTCALCLEAHRECLWCESHKQCVPKIAFDVIFPYQQCLQVLERGRDTCDSANCSKMKSCQECHTLPGCGWCDDISATGLGRCMEGGYNAPFHEQCASRRWYFMECPACQCHGHSKCSKENICGECHNHTTGSNCDQCVVGYFGDPRNGGECQACQCSAHAESCTMDTGVCNCLTLGVSGRRCDECDEGDGYYGNISKDSLCYFAFRMTRTLSFNLTGKRRLGFAYYPNREKRNVRLEVRWSKSVAASAYLNVTSFYAHQPDKPEVMVDEKRSLGTFVRIYRYHDFDFGSADRFGLRGYVYDVSCEKTCFLKVHITQSTDNIDLLEFFLTFFGCFLSLLIVAGIVWKVRNHYISFLLSRQRREERHKMASRPFSKVSFLVQSPVKATPGLVSVEPCANRKASVLTVLVRLPGDKWGLTPTGQSGVCFASVLASHSEAPGNNTAGKTTRTRTRKRCSATSV